jgi:hypothetical protein
MASEYIINTNIQDFSEDLKTWHLASIGVEEGLRSISLLYVAKATHRYE